MQSTGGGMTVAGTARVPTSGNVSPDGLQVPQHRQEIAQRLVAMLSLQEQVHLPQRCSQVCIGFLRQSECRGHDLPAAPSLVGGLRHGSPPHFKPDKTPGRLY
jgi:hypothetical protein